jgi:hypothetical protein
MREMTRRMMVEAFADFDVPPRGIPELRSWRGAKTMSLQWYGGSMRDYARARLPDTVAFEAALNCEGMNGCTAGDLERLQAAVRPAGELQPWRYWRLFG